MPPRTRLLAVALTICALSLPGRASAANILFVADYSADTSIATVLADAGHTVESVTGDFSGGSNARLRTSLAGYDAIFWSATGGAHTDTIVFANLSVFAASGGRVFVTGYNALSSDPMLVSFLGGTSSSLTFTTPGPIAVVESSLTVGAVDIRGITPTGSSTNNCLSGLGSDVEVIVGNGADTSCGQWTVRQLGAGEAAWVSSGSTSVWTNTTVGGPGVYNAAIRNFADAREAGMSEPGAPEISFDVPTGLFEGDEVTVRVVIEDFEGDTFTFSWDLDDDGVFGENGDEFSYTVPEGTTDGPSGTRLGVEAVDAAGNTATRYLTLRVTNIPPTVVSEPPTVVSILVDMAYQIEVEDPAGENDPPTFELVRGPDRMSVSDGGLVTWVPNESEVTSGDETVAISIAIDDGDGGMVSHDFEVTVSPNRQPSAPVPSFPTDLIAILDRQPRLAAQNAEDLDLDTLGYTFQIDTVDTFDSENLRQSPVISETPGFTAWELDEPLAENRLYHWRVRANDGLVNSEWRQTSFYVVRDPSLPPPDGGVSADAGVVIGDGGLIPGIDAGTGGGDGGCAAAPGRGRDGAAALLGLALLGLLVRRRRA